jgi:hypothetical protein
MTLSSTHPYCVLPIRASKGIPCAGPMDLGASVRERGNHRRGGQETRMRKALMCACEALRVSRIPFHPCL